MLTYRGINALSDFRTKKLLARLQDIDNDITDVSAEYVHFAATNKALSSDEAEQLKRLTTYGTAYTGSNKGKLFLVVPRPGTISPWSSKATDIAHNTGLLSINRIERGIAYFVSGMGEAGNQNVAAILHDRMTEVVFASLEDAEQLFQTEEPRQLGTIELQKAGKQALIDANDSLGLALADDEVEYLFDSYTALKRNPTDVELMMFAQVNSEHCRHKVFNADWNIDGKNQPKSLFKMIKNTYEQGGEDVISAYSDNAAVIKGPQAGRFFSSPDSNEYSYSQEAIHSVIKVETHNHPTAIAPVPGAATGIGGEIRDEAATGRGAKSKMGLTGFTVSNLEIPGYLQPWEKSYGKPDRIVSALDIMLEAPIGGAGFANEFGRPNLLGYFRTFEQQVDNETWGYHKPIMIAGGLGNIRDQHTLKNEIPAGAKIIVLGGPSMLIGLGGGAASSMETGVSSENLDFASVQRGNGEIERRAQQVIDACWSLGEDNPIISIHDVGAGGLSNALPELVHDSGRGATFDLRSIPSAEPGLSPLEIWCNEAQERYVLAIDPQDLDKFTALCERERAPFAVVGKATEAENLIVKDSLLNNNAVDLPLDVLFGKPPKMTKVLDRVKIKRDGLNFDGIKLEEAVERVLQLPSVGSKKFLITIGDRTVGGLTTRDQMVGPWQVPVADVAVTAVGFDSDHGEAMAMGERSPIALIDAPSAARMAVGETITNILSSDVQKLSDIKLSANWMAAVGHENENQNLFDSVKAVGEDFCPALGITIPVGKDSTSMKTKWDNKFVTSPISLVITGFSPVESVAKTITPLLNTSQDTSLVLVDLGGWQQRLGGSAFAQVYNQLGDSAPDADAETLKKFFAMVTKLKKSEKILAYHDRSDGGLLAAASEMAFASRTGLNLDLSDLPGTTLQKLFNEELGAVIQVKSEDEHHVLELFGKLAMVIGKPTFDQEISIRDKDKLYSSSRAELEELWSQTSYRMQSMRDNPESADQEFAEISNNQNKGLVVKQTFDITTTKYDLRPKVAVFREQGVNGQVEMAAAFDRAGFTAVDVHLNDLLNGKHKLSDFVGLAAGGGFSYGDVLGAGGGWAKTILFSPELRKMFEEFFIRPDTFTFGACNGCQMLSGLKELIPGAENWPAFLKNKSEQFEARVVLTKINKSPSIMFNGLEGSQIPVPVAHGEGRAVFDNPEAKSKSIDNSLVAAQYINSDGEITETYPTNPNGSEQGITALTTPDGRATIMMPHPERAFQSRQLSWHPDDWGEDSPWMQIFNNARAWVEKTS